MVLLATVPPLADVAEPPQFVLVHGLASTARMWDLVAGELAQEHCSCVAVDLRGHGQSPKPPTEAGYGTDEVLGDLIELFENQGWSGDARPCVVGQSWGGNLVIELATRRPDLVRSVMAVDGGTIRLQDSYPDWNDCERAKAPRTWDGVTIDQLRRWMIDAHPDWTAQGIQSALSFAEVLPDGSFAPWLTRDRHLAVLRGLWEHDPIGAFSALQVPALLAMADSGDAAWTEDKRVNVRRCIDVCPNPVGVEWFINGDHDLHVQYPARIATLMIQLHLTSHPEWTHP